MNEPTNNNSEKTRIDFYLLPGTNSHNIQLFCCRLAEKAWKLGYTVFVRTEDEQQAQYLDNLMWTYSDGSFLPHAIINDIEENDAEKSEAPIVIGSKTAMAQACDLMINLASDLPKQCNQYARIAEILNDDETIKSQGRLRYAQYDKNSYPLSHHNISA